VACWRFDSSGSTGLSAARLLQLEMGGAPVHCIDWSRSFHAITACSLSSYAPIRITCFDARMPRLDLSNTQVGVSSASGWTLSNRHQRVGRAGSNEAAAASTNQRRSTRQQPHSAHSGRAPLPERLTPDHVHALLRELRASAGRRGLCKQSDDPDGQHLVVPAERAEGAEGVGVGQGSSGRKHCSADREVADREVCAEGADASTATSGGANRRRYGGEVRLEAQAVIAAGRC